jgi:hypothetical protein
MSEREEPRPESYEPPQVEEVPTTDGPAVTAAGESTGDAGAEWRPSGDVAKSDNPDFD